MASAGCHGTVPLPKEETEGRDVKDPATHRGAWKDCDGTRMILLRGG